MFIFNREENVEGRQWTYDVTSRCVHLTLVAMEKVCFDFLCKFYLKSFSFQEESSEVLS
jgi:hypothetical protein